jgi:hypothetical protein
MWIQLNIADKNCKILNFNKMGYTSTSKNSCAIIVINTIGGMGMLVAIAKRQK